MLIKFSHIENETAIIATISDITKLKQQDKDENAVRMMFVTKVTHELRTPLNSIIPMSKRLKRYVSDPQGISMLEVVISAS